MKNQKEQDKQPSMKREQFERAVAFAQQEGLFQRLNVLYETIPEGECSGCAACCMESVETYGVEFLQIYAYLQERADLLQQLKPEILRFFLLEGVEKRPCPFQLAERRCAIYPVRPLPCRLFGHWGEQEYESNYEVTLRSNREVAEFYRTQYGLQLPETVINYKVPYCQTFRKPEYLTQEKFYDLLDGIIMVQSRFLFAELLEVDQMMMGLVTWWMAAWYDLDDLQDEKIAIIREFLEEGRTVRLEAFLNEAKGSADSPST